MHRPALRGNSCKLASSMDGRRARLRDIQNLASDLHEESDLRLDALGRAPPLSASTCNSSQSFMSLPPGDDRWAFGIAAVARSPGTSECRKFSADAGRIRASSCARADARLARASARADSVPRFGPHLFRSPWRAALRPAWLPSPSGGSGAEGTLPRLAAGGSAIRPQRSSSPHGVRMPSTRLARRRPARHRQRPLLVLLPDGAGPSRRRHATDILAALRGVLARSND